MSFEISNLAEHPELLHSTIRWVEEAFGYHLPFSMEIDFAPLWDKKNHHLNFIIYHQGQSICHLGLRKKKLIHHNYPSIDIALIGGIATRPEFRGLGLFQKLMNFVIDTFINDVHFFILWSDKIEFYAKWKFNPGLLQVFCNNGVNEMINFKKTLLKNLSEIQIKMIKNLYNKFQDKIYLPERNEDDWENIKKISSCDLYINEDSNGKIIAYFFINKGMDLQGFIHEWFYETDNIMDQRLHQFIPQRIIAPNIPPFNQLRGIIQNSALIRPGNKKVDPNPAPIFIPGADSI